METLARCQRKWEQERQSAVWTKTLFRDVHIRQWQERKFGEITYASTQFLTGHGCFASYLFKYKKRESPECMYGDSPDDTAEHMLLHCERFQRIRAEAELALEQRLSVENVAALMLKDRSSWGIIKRMMQRMVEVKEREEREIVERG